MRRVQNCIDAAAILEAIGVESIAGL